MIYVITVSLIKHVITSSNAFFSDATALDGPLAFLELSVKHVYFSFFVYLPLHLFCSIYTL